MTWLVNKKMKTGIYKIINLTNGKFYIGSAVNIPNRWSVHKAQLNQNKHSNSHLQKAWIGYGANAFIIETILSCPKSKLLYHEQLFLNKYFDSGIKCYNICSTAGNRLGTKHSKQTKDKLSKARKGLKLSAKWRKKMSKSKLGKKNPNYGNHAPRNELRSNNSSGYAGISWDKGRNKWRAVVGINGKLITLGRFDNLKDAIEARQNY